MKDRIFCRGQNVLEYILMVTAVVVVLIGVFVSNDRFAKSVNGVMGVSANIMEFQATNMAFVNTSGSRVPPPIER